MGMKGLIQSILELLIFVWTIDALAPEWISVGTTYSFTCVVPLATYSQLMWIRSGPEINQTVFLCEKESVPNCVTSINTDLYKANSTLTSTTFTSIFTINAVKQSDARSEWFCQADGNQSVLYTLHVYEEGDTPECGNVSLFMENSLQILCKTDNIYPAAICVFYINTNDSENNELLQGSINYTSQKSISGDYYTTKCIFTIFGGIVGPGSHLLYVKMYPNITTDFTEKLKKESNKSPKIVIGYPHAVLAPNCQVNGYIKENENVTCTCYDDSTSFFPTYVTWTNRSRTENLTYIANRSFNGIQRFQCISSNKLNWTNGIPYQPNVAYPPYFNKMGLNDSDIDLCDSKSVNIDGMCLVGGSNPAPNVYLNIENSWIQLISAKNNNEYSFNVPIPTPGLYNVSCFANNSEYLNVFGLSIPLTIRGPPATPKITRLDNKDINNTLEYKRTTILCNSVGGYPVMKNISLHCGEITNQAITNSTVILTLNLTSQMRNMMCTCTVMHASNCLQNTSTMVFTLDTTDQVYHATGGSADVTNVIAAGISAFVFVVISALMLILINKRLDHLRKFASNGEAIVYNNSSTTGPS